MNLIDTQNDHEQQRREFEERLLTSLNLHNTGITNFIPPRTPSITTHDHISERLVEKKEIRTRGIDVRAYPNIPFAAGLALGFQSLPRAPWQPVWQVFPLKAFRGSDYTFVKIQSNWDDAELLRELSKTYNRLRTWRRWLSLRNVRCVIQLVICYHKLISL